jgi:peptidoglycan/xylan/chitin deacetylase (PgdA/CDA1 family)
MPPSLTGQCVLTLHRVVDDCELDHDLLWSAFLALLDAIGAVGARVTTDLRDPDSNAGAITLTFDDGTADHFRVAAELASRGMSGIFFIPAAFVGQPSRLSRANVEALARMGHVIGSHTCDHPRLEVLPEDELIRQVTESKRDLEAIGGTVVEYFAPPGGSEHPDLARVLEDAGYTASRSTRWGFYGSRGARWAVPCLPVTDYTWRRAWIRRSLADWKLPLSMRLAWELRRVLPSTIGARVRHRMAVRVSRSH